MSKWKFYGRGGINIPAGSYANIKSPIWKYGEHTFDADKNGWVEADDYPPEFGRYITCLPDGVFGYNFFSEKWGWGSLMGDVLKWKPIIPPVEEEKKSRFYVDKSANDGAWIIRDGDHDLHGYLVAQTYSRKYAEMICDSLNREAKCS